VLYIECGFRIKFCEKCGICFHRDIMAAENMVNKGLSHVKNDLTIASYLDAVSDSKNDDVPGSSGSQKKPSGKRKFEGGKEVSETKKSRKTSQSQGDFDIGSKGKRESEGGEGVSRILRPRTSNSQNPDLDLNQGESQDF
jgi:hypothetical protein